MRSSGAVCLVVVLLFCRRLAIAVTEGHPVNDKMQHRNEFHTEVTHENRININNAKENTVGLDPESRPSTKSRKKTLAPMVDDDLLEFLVRVADNPAEWNKIQRVLSMLGRDEMGGTTTTPTSTPTTVPPTSVPPTSAPPTSAPPTSAPPTSGSWPSGDWILETVENINAAARARGIRAGGSAGPDPFDYDDDDDDDDEIEEIEAGVDDPLSTTAGPPPPPPPSQRVAAGHMSRYQFRRMDGRPDDGRVNGTYVAVVESAGAPRGVVYDPVRQKKPKPAK